MRKHQWRVRKRKWGQRLPTLNTKVSEALHAVLPQFAARVSQQVGEEIGQGAILETLALEAEPELRKLVREQERGQRPSTPSKPPE